MDLLHVQAALSPTGGPERTPPTEFCIFRFGKVSTTKGEFLFDEKACDALLLERSLHQADVQIDYDHQAIDPKHPGDGKAAGWCSLEKRADGLYAVDVKWTPAAAEMLRNGEYRYFSPYFGATKDTKQIVVLMNIAITGIPAMHNIDALVAASVSLPAELQAHACVIKHEGDKWNLYDSEGKKLLGSHPSKEAAQKQESAINISKARKAGHNIPHQGKEGQQMAHKLGGFLAKHLKEKGMSIGDMAKKSGMHEDRMRALYDGEDPTPEEMKAVGKAMGLKDGEIDEKVEASAMDNQDPGGGGQPDDEDDMDKDEQREPAAPMKKASRSPAEEMNLDIVELTGTTDRAKQRAKLQSVFAMAEQFVALKSQFDENNKKLEAQRRESLIERGKAEGKLTPSLIRVFAKRPIAEFEEFLNAAPILSVQNLQLREGESTHAAATLTAAEIEVCRLTNFSPDKLAQFVVDERSGKNKQLIYDTYYSAQQ